MEGLGGTIPEFNTHDMNNYSFPSENLPHSSPPLVTGMQADLSHSISMPELPDYSVNMMQTIQRPLAPSQQPMNNVGNSATPVHGIHASIARNMLNTAGALDMPLNSSPMSGYNGIDHSNFNVGSYLSAKMHQGDGSRNSPIVSDPIMYGASPARSTPNVNTYSHPTTCSTSTLSAYGSSTTRYSSAITGYDGNMSYCSDPTLPSYGPSSIPPFGHFSQQRHMGHNPGSSSQHLSPMGQQDSIRISQSQSVPGQMYSTQTTCVSPHFGSSGNQELSGIGNNFQAIHSSAEENFVPQRSSVHDQYHFSTSPSQQVSSPNVKASHSSTNVGNNSQVSPRVCSLSSDQKPLSMVPVSRTNLNQSVSVSQDNSTLPGKKENAMKQTGFPPNHVMVKEEEVREGDSYGMGSGPGKQVLSDINTDSDNVSLSMNDILPNAALDELDSVEESDNIIQDADESTTLRTEITHVNTETSSVRGIAGVATVLPKLEPKSAGSVIDQDMTLSGCNDTEETDAEDDAGYWEIQTKGVDSNCAKQARKICKSVDDTETRENTQEEEQQIQRGPVKLMLKVKFKKEQEKQKRQRDASLLEESRGHLGDDEDEGETSKDEADDNMELMPGATVIDTGKEKVIWQPSEFPEPEIVEESDRPKPLNALKTPKYILDGGRNLMSQLEVKIQVDEDTQVIFEDGRKRWKCSMCEKSYSTKHNLINHMLGHSGIKPHHCVICNKFFKQQSHLNTHLMTHRNIKPYQCKVCTRSFTQASHMKRHMAIHMEKRPHVCEICNRGFAYPSELKAHMDKHRNNKENTCRECGDVFDTPRKLKTHTQTKHRDAAELTCKECGKQFTYPSQLRDHMVKHSGSRPFMCGECGMEFMKEHHLKAHQFTHTGLRPHACPQCSRSFNQRANMLRHMLIHESDKKFKCDQCGRQFTQPQTLKAHMVTHADKKPFQCKLCGKEFGRLHNLQGHMHMHEDNKPHVCFCGASFTLKGNLNRHRKVKHDGEGESCTEEEAAQILNAMSNKRMMDDVEDPERCRSPRKKRKSSPRKVKPAEGDEDDLENEWGQQSGDEGVASRRKRKPRKNIKPKTALTDIDEERDDNSISVSDDMRKDSDVSDDDEQLDGDESLNDDDEEDSDCET